MNNLLTSAGSATISVIVLVIIAFFSLYGFIRGFARTFISIFGTILSILFAILLCTSVASFLESHYSFVSFMSDKLGGVLGSIFGEEIMNMPLEYAAEQTLKDAGLSSLVIKLILSFKSNSAIPSDTALNQLICPTFAYYLVLIISAIGLFIVFKLIFFCISKIVKRWHDIKLVAKIDKSLGLVLGFVSGIIYVETFIMIIGAIPIGFMQDFYNTILSSPVAYFICLINPFDSILNLISFSNISKFVSGFIKI